MNHEDIYVVDTFEEAEQFRYTDSNETVSVGTAVGYDVHSSNAITLTCFEGIHYDPDTTTY
jgi:hypothetical protein